MPMLVVQMIVKCPRDNKDVDTRICFRECTEWRHLGYLGTVHMTMKCGFGELPERDAKVLAPKRKDTPVEPEKPPESRSQQLL